MRKFIFIIIAVIAVAVTFGWVRSCHEDKTDTEMFGQKLTYADMYEYKNPDFGFAIRYPSFFEKQPDSLNTSKGRVRFSYNDQWATVVIEGYVMYNKGQPVRSAADSLSRLLHSTDSRLGKDYFVLSGAQYENGSRIDGYSYYSKFVRNGRLWFVNTLVYPDRYRNVLGRLFKEVDNWQIWERKRPQLRQGESQTPKARWHPIVLIW